MDLNQTDSRDRKNILVTGGAGFIGGTLIRRLLIETDFNIYNVDKLGYASNLQQFESFKESKRLKNFFIDLLSINDLNEVIKICRPDIVFHLAAESHVDRSIEGPEIFLKSNIIGTFNLLQALVLYRENLASLKKSNFRMIHVSTDEVFGSVDEGYFFSEKSQYKPRSPYSASKAASDHLVKAWGNTYGIPVIVTNCSNNYGPWQFPEKLIPVVINSALNNKRIPIYGTGENIRDWIFVEDHIDALLKVAFQGEIGESYCIGGGELKTNNEIVEMVCELLDLLRPIKNKYINLKEYVSDRKGHDKRYAIDNSKINKKLNWFPKYKFKDSLALTVNWYLENIDWCKAVIKEN